MLKKRILASSMASVMALSAVSVVAFADETATDIKSEYITKAVLKEYVESKEIDNLVNGDIFDYGTIQADNFQNAYDHAQNVIADSKATNEDATAAYQMLKSVKSKLEIITAERLKALLDECKPTYDKNNIRNDELNDNIYDPAKFGNFQNAYDTADLYVDSEDGRLISDAYYDLKDKYDALKELPTVTKQQFRDVIRDFDAMLTKKADYEMWRRGTVSVKPTTGSSGKDLTKAVYVTYGDLYDIVWGNSDVSVVSKVNEKAADDVLTPATDKTWIAVSAGKTSTDTATTDTVYDLVKGQFQRFDKIKSSNTTSDLDVMAAYKAAQEAVNVFKSWKADNTARAAKANITTTINKYRAKLAADYATDLITNLTGTAFDGKLTYDADAKTLKATANITLKIDKSTNLICVNAAGTAYNAAPDANSYYEQPVSAKQDIMKYIPIKAANVTNTTIEAKEDALKEILTIVEAYAAAAKANTAAAYQAAYDSNDDTGYVGLDAYDENGTVAKPAGSTGEYTLINRALTYALSDLYPEATTPCKHTKKNIQDLIKSAYDLADDTGDSYVFAALNKDLADEREDALLWVTEANATKGYKDNETEIFGVLSDEEYHDLFGAYDALKKEFAKYPYSYGEIAAKIAKVSNDIDDGVYGKSADTVKAALDAVSYGLSTLVAHDENNAAFTSDRELNEFNRLYVVDDNVATSSEKALTKALKALDTAIEDASKEPEVVKGDLDGDGKYSPADARAALELFLAGEYNEAADMDGNGIVNAKDARAILELWLQA